MTPALSTSTAENSLSAARRLPPLPAMDKSGDGAAGAGGVNNAAADPMAGLVSQLGPVQSEVSNILASIKRLAGLLPMYAPQFAELVSAVTNILPMAAQQMMQPQPGQSPAPASSGGGVGPAIPPGPAPPPPQMAGGPAQ
jgi:hypothetical protein